MIAGLATSTVTPGNTPPEASLTTPAMLPAACAHPCAGSTKLSAAARPRTFHNLIASSIGRQFTGGPHTCRAEPQRSLTILPAGELRRNTAAVSETPRKLT